VGGDGKGGGAALPRSDREARVAELAGYAVHQLRVYRLQKIESEDDGNTPIIMLRRGQIVVPLPVPRRLLVRREAVDVANGDGLVSILSASGQYFFH